MGRGHFTELSYTSLRSSKSYDKARVASDIFTNKDVIEEMKPVGITIRECRDSVDHPSTLAIQIWLDNTGSMGRIPFSLCKDHLANLMIGMMDKGVIDPQVFFGAIGDHEYDRQPLQVGQFEQDAQLLDKWLSGTYLEGGGGSNAGESYLLAWYFAAKHTSIDCFEKRGQKGFLFTIGDEPTLLSISGKDLKKIMGDGQFDENYTAQDLLKQAQEKYNVYHIHCNDASHRNEPKVFNQWKELLGQNFVVVEDYKLVADTIAGIVANDSVKLSTHAVTQDDFIV